MRAMQRAVRERDPLRSREASPSAPRSCHLACTREDLVDVLDEALSRGSERARQDASGVRVDTDAVFCRAEAACDEAL